VININHHYHQLSDSERDLIALYRGQGLGVKRVAKILGRSHSSIIRELHRNSFQGKHYVAIHAQGKSRTRKSLANSHPKIVSIKWLDKYLRLKLQLGWSPEQIAGRLKLESGKPVICHETIYAYIYQKDNQKDGLREYLVRHHKKRRKWTGRRVHRGQITQRVSIHKRANFILKRKQFGHWEDDTVEGKGHKDGVHTTIERKTRFYLVRKVGRIDSLEAIVIQKQIFSRLPILARRSVTMDNGRENHLHFQLKDELGIKTYFADPYSSWQRGSNENANGIFRRYFPKGTDFAKISQTEINQVVKEINSRPRKCLGYNTSQEVFNLNLKMCTSR